VFKVLGGAASVRLFPILSNAFTLSWRNAPPLNSKSLSAMLAQLNVSEETSVVNLTGDLAQRAILEP